MNDCKNCGGVGIYINDRKRSYACETCDGTGKVPVIQSDGHMQNNECSIMECKHKASWVRRYMGTVALACDEHKEGWDLPLWINIKDRNPDKSEEYLVIVLDHDNNLSVATCFFGSNWWDKMWMKKVIAWQPLPEVPEAYRVMFAGEKEGENG